jgi:hypothetical protein
MECNRIQEKLSEYIDGIISSEEKLLIEKHLKTCRKCKESFADMKKTIEYVRNLEDIEPPAWLTQKVMARIRPEVKSRKRIMQKLFYPLHVKLPIQAVATVLIAIVTIYIFKTMEPEVRFVKTPSGETEHIMLSPKEYRPSVNERNKSIHQKRAEEPAPAEEAVTRSDKSLHVSEAEQALKRPMVSKEQKAPAPVLHKDEVMLFEGGTAKDVYQKTEAFSRSPKVKASPEKEGDIRLILNVRDTESASKNIEEIITQLEGKIIKTESFNNKKVLVADLSSRRIEELVQKLKHTGEIEEKKSDLKELEGIIRIKIEIVKI